MHDTKETKAGWDDLVYLGYGQYIPKAIYGKHYYLKALTFRNSMFIIFTYWLIIRSKQDGIRNRNQV